MASIRIVFPVTVNVPDPPGGAGPCPINRTGVPATNATVPPEGGGDVSGPVMLPSCPEAVRVPWAPGALLRVKLKSLSAWPALPTELTDSVLVRMTCTVPAPVVTWADAWRLPESAVKIWTKALAGLGPEARARSAMTKVRRVKLSFMRCFSLRDLYVFGTRPAARRRRSEKVHD